MAYTILELTEIPREKDKLRAIIGGARYQQRKQKIIRYCAYAIMILAVMILALSACSHQAKPKAKANHSAIYIPLVMR